MESEANGSDASGAHSVTPGPGLVGPPGSYAACARPPGGRCAGPQAPTCSNSKPNTSSSARRASAVSSRSTRAAERALEPVDGGTLSRGRCQSRSLYENTSEVRMLQVKYARKMSNMQRHFAVRPVRAFSDNYIWLIERRWRPAGSSPSTRAKPRPCVAELAPQRRKLSRDFADSPSSRPYRRGRGLARTGARSRSSVRTMPESPCGPEPSATMSAASCRSWDFASIFWRFLGIL